ncbi:predicted protein, partial [Nematostella vectensis]
FDIDTFGTFNMSKAVYNSWFKGCGGCKRAIDKGCGGCKRAIDKGCGGCKRAIAMAKHLAVEWGPQRVRVNCVAPGPIEDTEGMSRLGNHSLPFFKLK